MPLQMRDFHSTALVEKDRAELLTRATVAEQQVREQQEYIDTHLTRCELHFYLFVCAYQAHIEMFCFCRSLLAFSWKQNAQGTFVQGGSRPLHKVWFPLGVDCRGGAERARSAHKTK